ncbi:MAG: ATP-binding protein [Nanoarchaeota archaeon]|nr:ATP-binding protein [Nanoarchaeota archaeon]MBU1632145.1 ATP-binding protein [Nanoarchaeota archaeon]MBU1876346.1 ATP-binding protein [Nanoarchaeota archaeon]
MILGRITGKVSTTQFQFSVSGTDTKKFQFIQVNHPEYGFVLGQVMELERTAEGMEAKCNVIGYKDLDGRIKGIRTPFNLNTEVLDAEDSFIKKIIELEGEGGFIGKLEGKDISVRVNLQKILTKHLAVLAKSGAGKSYTVGVLLEEIMEKNVPLLIIDPHGEYSSMKEPSDEEQEKLIAWNIDKKRYSQKIQEYGDLNINENLRPLKLNEKMSSYELMKILPIQLTNTQEAILFSIIKDLEEINFDNIILGLEQLNSSGKWSLIDTMMYLRDLKLFSAHHTSFNEIIQPGKCSIINLKGISPEVQEVVVYKLLKDLFLARKQDKIPPFFCVIEEAHNFCPEKGFGRAKSSEVIRLISSEGRKFGLGLCVVSQRPALVQKTVLAQCSTQIIMKITNPNDLRAITGSIEGITSEATEEIQNLPVGSALVCGIVDRPLVVNIRPRKSKHGGHAVNILGNSTSETYVPKTENRTEENIEDGIEIERYDQEYNKDVFKENKKFEEKNLLSIIKPTINIKEIKLMSERPISKITTYLIPAIFFSCKFKGENINFLVDKIKGKIILNPEKDEKRDIFRLDLDCNFLRKPSFESINYDTKMEEKISSGRLREELSKYCKVDDFKECFIVYYKIDY